MDGAGIPCKVQYLEPFYSYLMYIQSIGLCCWLLTWLEYFLVSGTRRKDWLQSFRVTKII